MAPTTRSASVSDLSVDDLRKLIRDEVHASIGMVRDEIKDVTGRLDNIEREIKLVSDLKETVSGIEKAIDHTSERMDDLWNNSLPSLAKHMEDIAVGLALQTLDLDVHRRKWSITIQGLEGEAGEDEDQTRDICVKLANEHLHLPDAKSSDFAACHRLSQQADSNIIIRFNDLQLRNKWLANAKYLRNHDNNISISPDLPPTLRGLKKELLEKRRELPRDERARHRIRHIRNWPYVVLAGPGNNKIVPEATKISIVEKVLGFSPRFVFN